MPIALPRLAIATLTVAAVTAMSSDPAAASAGAAEGLARLPRRNLSTGRFAGLAQRQCEPSWQPGAKREVRETCRPLGRASALTAAQEKPTSQVPTLGRPTKPDDPAPLLDFFAYFKGSWNVTWDYPESPLGPADVLTGTTTYTQKGPTTFVATTAAENSAGKFTIDEVFEYDRDKHAISRTVTDSRGFAFTQKGTVNGDLGGQFTIRLDGEPFTVKGQQVRMNSVMRLLSPYNYRVQSNLSVDGGPFTNFGNPWWRKAGASR